MLTAKHVVFKVDENNNIIQINGDLCIFVNMTLEEKKVKVIPISELIKK
jgi:hypothetical protein